MRGFMRRVFQILFWKDQTRLCGKILQTLFGVTPSIVESSPGTSLQGLEYIEIIVMESDGQTVSIYPSSPCAARGANAEDAQPNAECSLFVTTHTSRQPASRIGSPRTRPFLFFLRTAVVAVQVNGRSNASGATFLMEICVESTL